MNVRQRKSVLLLLLSPACGVNMLGEDLRILRDTEMREGGERRDRQTRITDGTRRRGGREGGRERDQERERGERDGGGGGREGGNRTKRESAWFLMASQLQSHIGGWRWEVGGGWMGQTDERTDK